MVLGTHKQTNIKYAIKFINKTVLEKRSSKINRLQREYKLLKDIDHANIVRLFAVYDSVQEVGFVMELCSGGHLGHWLESMKYEPIKIPPEPTVKSIMRQLLSAVIHMHSRGICHRDIKLQNILRESNHPDAQIKLCDFGLGTRFIGALPLKTHCGTLYCTAPEVIRESYDQRCDIWSCGVVAFTLLCGRKPFEALVMNAGAGVTAAARSSLTANILMGRFHFKNKQWNKRSRTSIEFVKLMMTQDYRLRWYAHEAREHAWFQESDSMKSLGSTVISPSHSTHDEMDSPGLSATSNKQRDVKPLLAHMTKQADTSVLHQASRLAVAYNMPQSKATDKRRQIFQAFDEDNNGSLSREEFQKAFKEFGMFLESNKRAHDNVVRDDESVNKLSNEGDGDLFNLSEADIDKVFDAIDVNGDNEISFTEFLAATLDPRDFDTMAINTAFGILDNKKKGYITADDMERVLAVTATARGRRRNSRGKQGNAVAFQALQGDRVSTSLKTAAKVSSSVPIRRHHSFTLGVKTGSRKQSLFAHSSRNEKRLSPVNSLVNGDSDSGKVNASSYEMSKEKNHSLDKKKGSDVELQEEDDIEKQLHLQNAGDERPPMVRQRSVSTISIGDFLRRPSLMSKNMQLEKIISERRNSSSSAFSFLNNLRSKPAPVSPVYVEEEECSTSAVVPDHKKVMKKSLYEIGDSDEEDHSNEESQRSDFPTLSSQSLLGHTNSFSRSKNTLLRENSQEENNLLDIDDRSIEQINRAIKLFDRHNTGVISYTGVHVF